MGVNIPHEMPEYWTPPLGWLTVEALSVTEEGTGLCNFLWLATPALAAISVLSALLLSSTADYAVSTVISMTPTTTSLLTCVSFPIISITQALVSSFDTVPHVHVHCLKSTISPSSASPLSDLSLKPLSSSPASVLHLSCLLCGVYSPHRVL